ncbi:DUF4386 domain-containing protein [Demequina sp. NBRC 110056]|uniref:DUF4386 domain-containing protein n=1 Tax=Demequina sp. NBRC 110056 TaxID=1570345 RepID=UPI0009FCF694|nr:DUF4386 domain-containing protein [Demequina sp. NBRC 110056]
MNGARRRAAIVAGVAYLAMFVLAIVANFVVMEGLIDPVDPAQSAQAIAADHGAFRLATVAFLAIAALDVVIAWALHVVLVEVHAAASRLAAWLRVAYGAVLTVAVGFLHVGGMVAAGGEPFGGLSTDDRHGLVGLSLAAFDAIWLVGLALFGLHLLVLGAVLASRRAAPRALGALVAVAGALYLADTLAQLGLADYEAIAPAMLVAVAAASMVAELWLAIWLVTVAGRTNVHLDPPQVGIPLAQARG